MEAFSEEEGFEGGVKSSWISVGNWGSGESIPDLRANNIYRPAIARRADDLTKEPLVADLSPRLAGICAVRVKGRYDGAWPRRNLKTNEENLSILWRLGGQ